MAATAKERKQKSRAKFIAEHGLEKFREIQNKQKAAQRHAKKDKLTDAEKILLREQQRVSKAKWRALKRAAKGVVATDSNATDSGTPASELDKIFSTNQSQGNKLYTANNNLSFTQLSPNLAT